MTYPAAMRMTDWSFFFSVYNPKHVYAVYIYTPTKCFIWMLLPVLGVRKSLITTREDETAAAVRHPLVSTGTKPASARCAEVRHTEQLSPSQKGFCATIVMRQRTFKFCFLFLKQNSKFSKCCKWAKTDWGKRVQVVKCGTFIVFVFYVSTISNESYSPPKLQAFQQ